MVSLIDIVPQTRTVEIAAGQLVLRGLGLRQVANLLLRFPSLRRMFEGATFDIDDLVVAAPDAAGAIIAEAANQPEASETVIDSLVIDDAIACLLVVRDLTMPHGPGPFFDRLTRLLANAADPAGRVPATSSPKRPNGSLPADTISAP